jgi:hypothetical protein
MLDQIIERRTADRHTNNEMNREDFEEAEVIVAFLQGTVVAGEAREALGLSKSQLMYRSSTVIQNLLRGGYIEIQWLKRRAA